MSSLRTTTCDALIVPSELQEKNLTGLALFMFCNVINLMSGQQDIWNEVGTFTHGIKKNNN